MDSVEELALLFTDASVSRITQVANEVAENQVFEDDLWTFQTSGLIVRRTLIDELSKREDLFQLFLAKLKDADRQRVSKFFMLKVEKFNCETEEQIVALQELKNTYGNDMWAWAQDAFKGEQEFPGSDLEGFDNLEICEAVVQLVIEQWETL